MNERPARDFWDRLNNVALVRFLLLFASGWALVQLLAYFETVIVTFTLAAVLALLLNYPVRWLQRFLPRGLAIGLVFISSLVLFSGLAVTVGFTLASQAQELVDRISEVLNSLIPLTERIERFLRDRNIPIQLNEIQRQFQTQFLSEVGTSIGLGLAALGVFFSNFINFILITVVAFFMLLDGRRLWQLLMKLVPVHLRSRFTLVVQRKFLGFFRGQFLLTVFLTTTSFLVFLILQVPFALLLAMMVGILDTIPGIGATLGVALVSLIVLSQSAWLALQVLVASVVLQQVQDNFIAPRVMQESLNINPVIVFFALLVGARVAGLLGIFLAIPIAAVLVSLFEIDEMKAEPAEKVLQEQVLQEDTLQEDTLK
ncbi:MULTISPECIES: AI-2E family transporter [Trichocoleus]|uniref:AI-2E family transporter n=1 Tax=Trichocoleus desertorum GB2-A4 TaxID=2933944 RepID=A0ABV0JDK1_9CYAN|nr:MULTISPECIES: AI-2E family transporter [unclassified Trichocoleus]MBD1861266.1 AI-2E family transporter [Trichocoleus sp. FACHB-46]MBD2121408.1 AI-2E family transporter [Trichocoleus sp. FACHB-262]